MLATAERRALRRLVREGAGRSAERAMIVLECADGAPDEVVAQRLSVTAATVRKWRIRFADRRLAGLVDDVRPGRPKVELVLTDDEREQLVTWAGRAKGLAGRLATRARIVLACADGASNVQVAADLGVSVSVVTRWRARFLAGRLDGLRDDPRSGRPRSILPDKIQEVVAATAEEPPKGGGRWSRASMSRRTGLSRSTVGRIWHEQGIRPDRPTS